MPDQGTNTGRRLFQDPDVFTLDGAAKRTRPGLIWQPEAYSRYPFPSVTFICSRFRPAAHEFLHQLRH